MKTIALLLAITCIAHATESLAPETPPKGLAASDWHSIRAAYEAGRHAIHRREDGTLTARNPGQQWHTEFDGKGFTVTPDHGQWTWGLELTGYGERTLLPTPSAITHEGGKISCQRDENLTEWFINDTRGLEQGWTIYSRSVVVSPTSSPLTLNLALRGDLKAQVSPDSSSVAFLTSSGSTALTYGGLKAWDADGKSLLVRFESAGGTAIRIDVEDQNARYPITIDPIAQQAYLKAGNNSTQAGDLFGSSVAISGDTVIVAAPYEASNATGVNGNQNSEGAPYSGAVYVFIRNGGTWTQEAYLKASNTGNGQYFGSDVAISENTIVVGAEGEKSNATGVNGNQSSTSAPYSGAVYVFTRSSGIWTQQAYIKASNTGQDDFFGDSVSISGETMVVGATQEDSNAIGVNGTQGNNSKLDSGAVYVFVRSGTIWTQQAYFKANYSIEGTNFGKDTGISGDTVVVGGNYENCFIFTRSGTIWTQQPYLSASNSSGGDAFGARVAISGNTIVVGANQEDSNATGVDGDGFNNDKSDAGAAYIFTGNGATWTQQAYLKASYSGVNAYFGASVAISGDKVIVGSPGTIVVSPGINSGAGAAYIFTRSGVTWSEHAFLQPSNPESGDFFGGDVAASGDTFVVGANQEDSNATGVNGDQTNNGAAGSGAAYVFNLNAVASLPEIAVQQAGADIAINTTKAFGPLVVGSTSDLLFTVFNTGNSDLTLTGTPSVAVTGSPDFTVTSQPSSPITGPSGSFTFTVRFSPSSIGSKNAVLSIPNNDTDENPFTINLSGSGVTADTAFDNAVSANSSLTGPDALPAAIPFGDGVENLLKYAFNMNLSGSDSHGLVSGTGSSGLPDVSLTGSGPGTMLRVEFLRRKGSGLVYTPMRSTTLSPGSFDPMGGTPVVTSIDTNWERVVVQESANPVALPKSFARVEVKFQ